MKHMKKFLLLTAMFSLSIGFVRPAKSSINQKRDVLEVKREESNNQLPSNLVDKKGRFITNGGADNGIDTYVQNADGDNRYYRVDFPNGTSTYFSSFLNGLNTMTTGSTLVLLRNMDFNYSGS